MTKTFNFIKTSKLVLLKYFVLCIFLLGCNPTTNAETDTKTFYVSPSGDDDNIGTKDYPWKSINSALNAIQPGDNILIREGVYVENINPQISGSHDSYITVGGYEGESVIIRSPNLYQWDTCLLIEKVSHIVFKNLIFEGANYSNILAVDESLEGEVNNIIFDNIISRDSFTGICFKGVNDSSIINSDIYNNQFNIELDEYNEDILIDNNHVYNSIISRPELEDYWSHNIVLFSTGESGKLNMNIEITNNNVHDAHMQGILVYRAKSIIVDNNHSFSNGSTGIQIESDDNRNPGMYTNDIVVSNNLCENNSKTFPSEAGIWIDDTIQCLVFNNIAKNNEIGIYITGSESIEMYDNIVEDNSHSSFINASGLVVSSSFGQAGQNGNKSTNCNIYRNTFRNNGGNSQKAQIVLGYYETDDSLLTTSINFYDNTISNTPESNHFQLDLQAYGLGIVLDNNRYNSFNRESAFFWQMNRDPWGKRDDDPAIISRIPNQDIHSTFIVDSDSM